MNPFKLGRSITFVLLAMPGLAYSMTARAPAPNNSGATIADARGADNRFAASSAGSMNQGNSITPDMTATFGGYNNSSSGLTSIASDGAGLYVVGGTTGPAGYVAIYNSATHNQVCEAAFVPVDPANPLHIYDQGHVFSVAFGNGGFYAAGEAHDTTSTPNDFDGFIQRFNGACQKVDAITGPVIEGGPDHDAFKGVTVSAAGVIGAGYIHLQGDDQFLAERWSADLATNAYAFFYPITGTAGGNHWNTIASDALGNAWTLGYLHLTPVATDQRLEENGLDPAGAVTGGQVFFASDSGPSEYTSVKLGADNLLYLGGTIVDTTLVGGPGPFGIFDAGVAQNFSTANCAIFFQDSISSPGMDIDAASPAHLHGVVVLNPSGLPSLPQAFVRLEGATCNPTEPGVAFGSTDGVDSPGGVSYDANTSSARNAAATTGTNFTPNTDGSSLVGASNGYVSEFGNFAP